MKKTIISMVVLAFIAWSCTEETDPTVEPPSEEEFLNKADIDAAIIKSLEENGEFDWATASDEMLWSALVHSDYTVTVGYQPENESNVGARIAQINIKQKAWVASANNLIDIVLQDEKSQRPSLTKQDLQVSQNEVLPYMHLKVNSIETIKHLRSLSTVRYLEPQGYEVALDDTDSNNRVMSGAGCGSNSSDYGIPSSDYTTISPNAKASWNFYQHNIPSAWNTSTGRGIGIGLIDTGVSSSQDNLSSNFNSGYSSGRTLGRYGFFEGSSSYNDPCGHGTSMAGVIAGPRSNDGSAVGVAYNSNFISVRGTRNVLINSREEREGVIDALTFLANRSDINIISMSIGNVYRSASISDAIRYAYGRGKLIFAAAGTSYSLTTWYGVIFPATMSETVAVTGVKEGRYDECDRCHSGRRVDFTINMQRSGSDNFPLTLADSGNQPSTVGGSSVATATAAGIAALVWATNPSMSRSQVLDRLTRTADLYPRRDGDFGWGNLDAAAAVRY